jgi:hypothetical protein
MFRFCGKHEIPPFVSTELTWFEWILGNKKQRFVMPLKGRGLAGSDGRMYAQKRSQLQFSVIPAA